MPFQKGARTAPRDNVVRGLLHRFCCVHEAGIDSCFLYFDTTNKDMKLQTFRLLTSSKICWTVGWIQGSRACLAHGNTFKYTRKSSWALINFELLAQPSHLLHQNMLWYVHTTFTVQLVSWALPEARRNYRALPHNQRSSGLARQDRARRYRSSHRAQSSVDQPSNHEQMAQEIFYLSWSLLR